LNIAFPPVAIFVILKFSVLGIKSRSLGFPPPTTEPKTVPLESIATPLKPLGVIGSPTMISITTESLTTSPSASSPTPTPSLILER